MKINIFRKITDFFNFELKKSLSERRIITDLLKKLKSKERALHNELKHRNEPAEHEKLQQDAKIIRAQRLKGIRLLKGKK